MDNYSLYSICRPTDMFKWFVPSQWQVCCQWHVYPLSMTGTFLVNDRHVCWYVHNHCQSYECLLSVTDVFLAIDRYVVSDRYVNCQWQACSMSVSEYPLSVTDVSCLQPEWTIESSWLANLQMVNKRNGSWLFPLTQNSNLSSFEVKLLKLMTMQSEVSDTPCE